MKYIYKLLYIDSTTSYVTLTPRIYINGMNYFLVTWKLADIISDVYMVMITPTPANGYREKITQLSPITLGLYDNVAYNVTISPGTHSVNIHKQFTIGKLLHLLMVQFN